MSQERIIHPITTVRAYYVAQVGRSLEVRAQDTHAVLEVVEPPRKWGEDWLWSCCEFDGQRCVSLSQICLLRTKLKDRPGPFVARSSGGDADDRGEADTATPPVASQRGSLPPPLASLQGMAGEHDRDALAGSVSFGCTVRCQPVEAV